MMRLARLPAVVRDGWRYPANRLSARPAGTAVDVLAALGFDAVAFEPEFDGLAPGLYAELAAAARAVPGEAAAEAAARLERPSPGSREAKKLLYLAVRALEPELVVETGTFNGAAAAFMLRALEANGRGRLLAFDVSDAADALGVPLPAGREPGWLVPAALRGRYTVVLGDVRRTLAARLAAEGPVDLFVHDSLHTLRHMLFEYRVAWRALRPGGLLVSDDVFWNLAFWLFTTRHRVPFRHTATTGATRKP